MSLITGVLPTGLRSPLLLHWRARDLSTRAVSGQAGTLTRPNVQSVFDLRGAVVSIGREEPAFAAVDTDLDGVRDTIGLSLGNSGEVFYLTFEAVPQAMTMYLRYVVPTVSVFNSYLAIVGPGSNPHFGIRTNGSGQILALYRNASGVDSVTTAQTVALGDVVEACATLSAAGVCGFSISRNSGAETFSTPGGAQALPAAWVDTKLYVGSSAGSTEIPMYALSLRVAAGVLTLQQMRDSF